MEIIYQIQTNNGSKRFVKDTREVQKFQGENTEELLYTKEALDDVVQDFKNSRR